jgi:hypothetical protein
MRPLTAEEVQAEVQKAKEYSSFDADALQRFIGIWQNRLHDAVHYHKRQDLEDLASRVISFVETTGAVNLKLYTLRRTNGELSGFLYNTSDGRFLEVKA